MARKKVPQRPFKTLYYNDHTVDEDAYASQGHSSSEEGAIHGCAWRIWLGRYVLCRVYNEDGTLIHTLCRGAHGEILPYFGRGQSHIKRVK